MICKYLILKKDNTPILFPKVPFSHLEVSGNLGNIVSAGFCFIKIEGNKVIFTCYGNSSTLGIESDPVKDKLILENFFNLYFTSIKI